MKKMNSQTPIRTCFALLLVAILAGSSLVRADRPEQDWQREEVDWRMTGGLRIRAVRYPKQNPLQTLATKKARGRAKLRKKILSGKAELGLEPLEGQSAGPILANVIDSPPIDGFVPWIVTVITDARLGEFELDAIPSAWVVGNPLPGSNPQSDYAIGLYDTGASAHIMGDVAAARAGLSGSYLTANMIDITGATGSVSAWVSEPIGLFIDGLGAIEPNGLITDDSGMVGESNVSIIVGDPFYSPGLPTAVGSPLSVYFAASVRNDRQVTVVRDSNEFTGPDIRFYDRYDPCIPNYSNTIYLELRPAGGAAVQYFPNLMEPFEPVIPSTITSLLPSQNLFFTSRTDLAHKNRTSTQKKLMVDTGAQITVISESQATELQLNKSDPNFWVVIRGVTGDTVEAKGFFIDSLEISADPEWLSFTHVPVVMLDVASPEGGTLDGIIGMNLFVDFNFVFRGGGLPDIGGHRIEFEFLPYRIIADIAPAGGDGKVDSLDLAEFVEAWLATPTSQNWNSQADMVSDATIDFLDFAVFAGHWRETIAP